MGSQPKWSPSPSSSPNAISIASCFKSNRVSPDEWVRWVFGCVEWAALSSLSLYLQIQSSIYVSFFGSRSVFAFAQSKRCSLYHTLCSHSLSSPLWLSSSVPLFLFVVHSVSVCLSTSNLSIDVSDLSVSELSVCVLSAVQCPMTPFWINRFKWSSFHFVDLWLSTDHCSLPTDHRRSIPFLVFGPVIRFAVCPYSDDWYEIFNPHFAICYDFCRQRQRIRIRIHLFHSSHSSHPPSLYFINYVTVTHCFCSFSP